jgi:predicted nuclease of restriction endonuclease-like RecB superfamily
MIKLTGANGLGVRGRRYGSSMSARPDGYPVPHYLQLHERWQVHAVVQDANQRRMSRRSYS